MELESLLSFKQTYFEPRCVLIITLDRAVQIQRLLSQGCTENECEIAVNRTEWYAEYNRDHPGFFDAVIVTGLRYIYLAPFLILRNPSWMFLVLKFHL